MPHTTRRNQTESTTCGSLSEQRNTIVFLTGIFFFNMISRIGIGPLLPNIETNLSINHIQAGGFFFLISTGYCLSLFGSIFLTPRFSHRNLIVVSSFAVGISLLIAAASQGLFMLQISMVAMGLAGGIYLPSGIASLTALVRRKDWGKMLGFHQLAPNLAYIIAPLVTELILSWQSWRVVLTFYGLASLILAFSYAMWGRGVLHHTDPPTLKPLKAMLRNPSILIITFLFALGMALNQGVFAILPIYLNFGRGLDPGWSNFMLALSRMAAFVFPLAAGWLADRFGVRRVMLIILGGSALGTFLVALVPVPWLLPALIVQAGSAVCIFPLCFAVLSMATTPQSRSIAVSVVVPVGHFLGSGLVPLVVGFLAEAGHFDFSFFGIGVFALVSLPLVQYLKKIEPRQSVSKGDTNKI